MGAGRGGHEYLFQVCGTLTKWPIIAQDDVIAFPALDRLGECHAAQGGLDHGLEGCHVDIPPGEFAPVRRDLEIFAAHDPVGEGRARSGYVRNGRFYVPGNGLNLCQIIARNLDANGRAHTC